MITTLQELNNFQAPFKKNLFIYIENVFLILN